MALVSYSSSSDTENDAEPPSPKILRSSTEKRLPLPSAIICMNKVIHPSPMDDPSKHDGRVRSFEHERGNWATLVYIPVELSVIDDVQTRDNTETPNSQSSCRWPPQFFFKFAILFFYRCYVYLESV